MPERLYQLTYLSNAKFDLPKSDIEKILEASRRNNHAVGVTGLLIYCDGVFVQVLEGEKPAVEKLFSTISDDNRHDTVDIIAHGEIEERIFPSWEMAYLETTPDEFDDRVGLKGTLDRGEALERLKGDESQIKKVLYDFASSLADGGQASTSD